MSRQLYALEGCDKTFYQDFKAHEIVGVRTYPYVLSIAVEGMKSINVLAIELTAASGLFTASGRLGQGRFVLTISAHHFLFI